MVTEIEKVAAAVREQYPSIHAFCRASGLSRTVVYQVLGDRYQGNIGRQLTRINQALASQKQEATKLPSVAELEEIIRLAACKRCPVAGQAEICKKCAPTHLLQAQAVHDFLQGKLGR